MSDVLHKKEGIVVPKFSLSEMCLHPSIILIAKRGSGKSWITKAILKKLCNIPVGIVIAPSEKNSPFYGSFFPDTFIFYKYDTNVIKNLLMRQKILIRKARKKQKAGKFLDTRAMVVMDDCLASKGLWLRDDNILELLFNGRHSHITYILTMQYVLGITPEQRSNFDYVFLLADDYISTRKKIYEHYAGMVPDFNTFCQVFTQLTENYGAMVIKNRGNRSSNFCDKIAYYKAPNLEKDKFMFGCDQFQKYHKKNYNKKWERQAEKFDMEKYIQQNKRAKSRLNVIKQD
jgi:hypothetical protein